MTATTRPGLTPDDPQQPVTVREVAARAAVSQATAARALGGYGYVSAAARRRVEEAAQQLGYRPNDVARALASGSTKTVGLIVGDIENPFFAGLARGVANAVEAKGYTVLLANSDEDLGHERRAVEAFRTRLVDGLIIAPVTGSESAHLRGGQRPVVLVDRAVRGLHVDTVTVTNAQGAATATAHLLALGHRRIGVVTDSPEIHSTAQRLRGYRRALRAARITPDESLISYGASTQEGAADHRRYAADRRDRRVRWSTPSRSPRRRQRPTAPRAAADRTDRAWLLRGSSRLLKPQEGRPLQPPPVDGPLLDTIRCRERVQPSVEVDRGIDMSRHEEHGLANRKGVVGGYAHMRVLIREIDHLKSA
jgi:DNA-binding LacI/PurR family transcriptional regulator